MPKRRQRVAFDASVNEKRAAALQFSKACPERSRRMDVLPSRICRRHLRRHRRDVIGRFAADENAAQHCDHEEHLWLVLPRDKVDRPLRGRCYFKMRLCRRDWHRARDCSIHLVPALLSLRERNEVRVLPQKFHADHLKNRCRKSSAIENRPRPVCQWPVPAQ
jgi:hypothetical protein